jgi:hypothetical protein
MRFPPRALNDNVLKARVCESKNYLDLHTSAAEVLLILYWIHILDTYNTAKCAGLMLEEETRRTIHLGQWHR